MLNLLKPNFNSLKGNKRKPTNKSKLRRIIHKKEKNEKKHKSLYKNKLQR